MGVPEKNTPFLTKKNEEIMNEICILFKRGWRKKKNYVDWKNKEKEEKKRFTIDDR